MDSDPPGEHCAAPLSLRLVSPLSLDQPNERNANTAPLLARASARLKQADLGQLREREYERRRFGPGRGV